MGPFKCPDCGVWWAGFEHRCRTTESRTITTGPFIRTNTFEVRCICPKDRGDNYSGTCPVHDIQVTYTGHPA
jgi:hypothetical protein